MTSGEKRFKTFCEELGFLCLKMDWVDKGLPDFLVGVEGFLWVVEVKDYVFKDKLEKSMLSEEQLTHFREYPHNSLVAFYGRDRRLKIYDFDIKIDRFTERSDHRFKKV